MFQEEEIGKLLAKNIAGTARRQLDERICYLENIFFAELTGLSLRAGGRGFPPATQTMAPGYFRR